MSENISFKTLRAIQICIVFMTTMAIQVLLNYPRAAWTSFAVMMIYVGFDSGATITRTIHRFLGAVMGLILSYLLWVVGQIDYRTYYLIIPLIVFFAYYSLGKAYSIPTIFTVTLSALGTIYYGTDNYSSTWLFSDYFICTLIALVICIIFEYYVFYNHDLHRKFYIDLQKSIINSLKELLSLAQSPSINKSRWLKSTIQLNKAVIKFNTFISHTKKSYHANDDFLLELEGFNLMVMQICHNLYYVFVLSPNVNELFILEIHNLINNLVLSESPSNSKLV